MEITRSDLTEFDLDVLSNMMLVFFHAGERCLQVCEQHFVKEHRASKDYQRLCRTIGKPAADLYLKDKAHKLLQHEAKFKYGEIIRRAEQLKLLMDNVTSTAIAYGREDINSIEAYDYLHNDVNWLCKVYAMITNFTHKDDATKLESTIKLLAKGNLTSDRVIKSFEQ
jgi:hypothetical protein